MTASRDVMTWAAEETDPPEQQQQTDSSLHRKDATTRAASAQSMSSLLAQALEVPSLDHTTSTANNNNNPLRFEDDKYHEESTSSSTATSNKRSTFVVASPPSSATLPAAMDASVSPMFSSSVDFASRSRAVLPRPLEEMMLLPQHSDFTIPTSNAARIVLFDDDNNNGHQQQQRYRRKEDFDKAPPLEISSPALAMRSATSNHKYNEGAEEPRRRIFGNGVGRRYRIPSSRPTQYKKTPIHTLQNEHSRYAEDPLIDAMPPPSPPAFPPPATYMVPKVPAPNVSPLTPAKTTTPHKTDDIMDDCQVPNELSLHSKRSVYRKTTPTTFHETIHAQSLLLGLAFMAVWSPNNAMAPNLTQMAESFQMTQGERDLYLGSYCALALGVFCLPISALLGFMADFYSRKHLFVCCVLGGSLASAWTGWSQTFASLFWARLMSGGCMSASVPVAFSLLGDLFSTAERNAASSGLTAMMGLGILLGQVYAGTIGPERGWQFPFFASAILSLSMALLVMLWVREPVRGAKEKALQGLLQSGNKYERQLTFAGFMHAMRHNRSNSLLLWQGFFTSLPWGIVFVFLNDYLSQEKGFSVPDATFMVMLFGVGCAIGGIMGGYIGQVCQERNRSLLPLFMAITTFGGTLPFLGLLNSEFPNKHGYKAMAYSILGGCIASLPSVNARPCILNVNPPETRGAALTAANLLITLGRGIGPSCITLMGSIFHFSRQVSFNLTLSIFWAIAAILLLFLVKTLPEDQDAMEEDLTRYAAALTEQQESAATIMNGGGSQYGSTAQNDEPHGLLEEEPVETYRPTTARSTSSEHQYNTNGDGEDTIVSIEDYMTSFDGNAARRSLQFVQQGIQEIREEMVGFSSCRRCGGNADDQIEQDREDEQDVMDEILPQEELRKRRNLWKHKQQLMSESQKEDPEVAEKSSEETPLLGLI